MGISKNGKIPEFSKNSINAGNFHLGVDSSNWLNSDNWLISSMGGNQ